MFHRDGWNTIVSFWDGLFSVAMLVLGRASSFSIGNTSSQGPFSIAMLVYQRIAFIIGFLWLPKNGDYLEDHPSGCKWLITLMVSKSPKDRGVGPSPNGHENG